MNLKLVAAGLVLAGNVIGGVTDVVEQAKKSKKEETQNNQNKKED